MALDREDMKFITEVVQSNGAAVWATIRAEIDVIKQMDEIRNGRICKAETNIKELKEQTKFARWIERNKKLAALLLLLFVFAAASAYHAINFKRTVERVLDIELKEK